MQRILSIFVLSVFAPFVALGEDDFTCAITETVLAQPPDDPNADPFFHAHWYINNNKSIWAGWDAPKMRVGRNKVLWIRPKETVLEVTAHHLDGDGEFSSNIPRGYLTGFQATGLSFTKPGCWKIKATSGGETLEFTTKVTNGT